MIRSVSATSQNSNTGNKGGVIASQKESLVPFAYSITLLAEIVAAERGLFSIVAFKCVAE
jgi:hypothetical protein